MLRAQTRKPNLYVLGMYGIGDNLHQRAVVRAMMGTNTVHLQTYYVSLYNDLVAKGGLILQPAPRAYKARIREQVPATRLRAPALSKRDVRVSSTAGRKVTYNATTVKAYGSILAAQFASVRVSMPRQADFSLPVPQAWRAAARRIVPVKDKPLLVYRPIVQNTTWACPARSPDPVAYSEIFRAIRERFFVVSVADLKLGREWVVGAKEKVDLELHRGELNFEALAGLFAEADLVLSNPGFAPVLAQAVGTPGIIVYGGNECHRTTNSVGDHLAPTLAIEPDRPCACHARFHNCDKSITLPPAVEKAKAFAATFGRRMRTLIFGTVYCDTPEKARLASNWLDLHQHLNPDCDFLLVDSASPFPPTGPVWTFPDNIGHLARGGADGWGRAFCKGLERAIEGGYDYVAHIEGDSLFRGRVGSVAQGMRRDGVDVASVPVQGTRSVERGWVETGLMFFRTGYLAESKFIERYDWPGRARRPTPEAVVYSLLGDSLRMMDWRAERDDRRQMTPDNVAEYDWITHCHDATLYDRFVEANMGAARVVKLNFGCGTNKLEGWQNFDAEVDISKRLPFLDGHADFIFAEHCVEHIDYYAALGFFKECHRVLKPGGVARIAVPSVERIRKHGDRPYFNFVHKWAPSPDVRGALYAALYEHGHKTAWTDSLLDTSLFFVGFDKVEKCELGISRHDSLKGAEGHGRVIGERMNWIESIAYEATKG